MCIRHACLRKVRCKRLMGMCCWIGSHFYHYEHVFPYPEKKIKTSDMCFLGNGTHITKAICFPGRRTHIFPHISRDMCFLGRGTHITTDMCFPGRETHNTGAMFS